MGCHAWLKGWIFCQIVCVWGGGGGGGGYIVLGREMMTCRLEWLRPWLAGRYGEKLIQLLARDPAPHSRYLCWHRHTTGLLRYIVSHTGKYQLWHIVTVSFDQCNISPVLPLTAAYLLLNTPPDGDNAYAKLTIKPARQGFLSKIPTVVINFEKLPLCTYVYGNSAGKCVGCSVFCQSSPCFETKTSWSHSNLCVRDDRAPSFYPPCASAFKTETHTVLVIWE